MCSLKVFNFSLQILSMCSVVDGSLIDESEELTPDGDIQFCQKCKKEKPILTLRKKDVYCKNCFLTNCNHKFRSTLGKNKAIKINDRVLVAFSGSQGSLAVLKVNYLPVLDDE